MKARTKIRSVVVKVNETRLNESQLSAISSDHFGVVRSGTELATEWVVDFIDFKHPGTGDKVYACFCMRSFINAIEAFEREPST